MRPDRQQCLVSSCLTGLCTRYDGRCRSDDNCLRALKSYHYIPVCPEQLGGLATPRPAADLTAGDGHAVLRGRARVITREGIDVTSQFIAGAEAVLHIARTQQISLAMLKAKSPSCGSGQVVGVTAALLLEHGITVVEF